MVPADADAALQPLPTSFLQQSWDRWRRWRERRWQRQPSRARGVVIEFDTSEQVRVRVCASGWVRKWVSGCVNG